MNTIALTDQNPLSPPPVRVLSPQAAALLQHMVQTTAIPTVFSIRCCKTKTCAGKVIVGHDGVTYCSSRPELHRGPDIIPDEFYVYWAAFDKAFTLTPRIEHH